MSAVVFLVGLELINIEGMRRIFRFKGKENLHGYCGGSGRSKAESHRQLKRIFDEDAFYETLEDVINDFQK